MGTRLNVKLMRIDPYLIIYVGHVNSKIDALITLPSEEGPG
jgi:hypothetical protein